MFFCSVIKKFSSILSIGFWIKSVFFLKKQLTRFGLAIVLRTGGVPYVDILAGICWYRNYLLFQYVVYMYVYNLHKWKVMVIPMKTAFQNQKSACVSNEYSLIFPKVGLAFWKRTQISSQLISGRKMELAVLLLEFFLASLAMVNNVYSYYPDTYPYYTKSLPIKQFLDQLFFICSSVGDPDPSDPYVFGPTGSGPRSVSLRYGSGSGSESFSHQAEIVSKTLIPTVLWLLFDFLSLRNDVNVPSKRNKQKNLWKITVVFCWHGQWWK